jgi:magnesium and cobalt transporter
MTETSTAKSGAAPTDSEPRSISFWERLRRWGGLADDPGNDFDDAGDTTGLDPNAQVLIGNILRLRDRTAWDVMVPRVDIIAVDIDTPFDRLVEIMIEEGHSRLPIYKDDLDHIQGMIHVKDVMGFVASGKKTTPAKLLRKVLFAAPSASILDMLTQMRAQRVHMAFVVDEFGGIDGLITIEDLVEEIVGDIEDEHDDTTPQHVMERPDGSLIVDSRMPIVELEALLDRSLLPPDAAEEVDTVGGLCFMLAGHIPQRGEILEHPSGLIFEVLEADQRRVRRLRIRHKPAELPALTD